MSTKNSRYPYFNPFKWSRQGCWYLATCPEKPLMGGGSTEKRQVKRLLFQKDPFLS